MGVEWLKSNHFTAMFFLMFCSPFKVHQVSGFPFGALFCTCKPGKFGTIRDPPDYANTEPTRSGLRKMVFEFPVGWEGTPVGICGRLPGRSISSMDPLSGHVSGAECIIWCFGLGLDSSCGPNFRGREDHGAIWKPKAVEATRETGVFQPNPMVVGFPF